ncbi:Hypothetical protein GbCGDNIH3_7102 [Granulibacter bethesdensis]|uniref:Uncharacterized protein n=1 Tax=Granulibacter bethesdensis TaxID=364410 RepID=A0AAN0RE34_9PROT|nr:Hypothetical protein GbCGDNIH3_7102 [Granulibacter bethesdensis]AHJ66219.1 Hypothetical protein GbCGDNIH4_7212 [Granulibacter bethesdensis CGDNIH4]
MFYLETARFHGPFFISRFTGDCSDFFSGSGQNFACCYSSFVGNSFCSTGVSRSFGAQACRCGGGGRKPFSSCT